MTSLRYLKSFHPAPFSLSGSLLRTKNFDYINLNSDNIQFIFDKYGLLYIKFVILKGEVRGTTFHGFPS